MKLNNLKKVLTSLLVVVFLSGFSAAQTADAKVMTMQANIVMSGDASGPAVNNSIQTINLTFSESVDPKTLADNVTLLKMDASGKAIEEPAIIKIDPSRPTVILINNKDVTRFPEGEAYKLVVTGNLKSTTGLALEKEFAGYFATNPSFTLSSAKTAGSTRSQIVVISDLHLGVDDRFAELEKNKPALVEFLTLVKDSPNVKELVILGDLFDGWFLPMDYKLPATTGEFFDAVAANNKEVVNILNKIIKTGQIKVSYAPGNHDLLMTKADLQRILPGINQYRDDVQGLGTYVTGADSEIAMEHGHRENFFCAPDTISNRDITKNNTSILPPGYFFTRVATTSVVEGEPPTTNKFPTVTANKTDKSQLDLYIYSQVWTGLMTGLPVKENSAEKTIKTNIDGYTEDYAINDFFPVQDPATGNISVKMYAGAQDNWDQRQTINGVKVHIPAEIALAKATDNSFTDSQSKTQFFDVDATKRIVVFGHTHVVQLLPFENLKNMKTIYANAGTWIDDAEGFPTMTFVVITPAKAGSAPEFVNIYKYGADTSITQWFDALAITK